jgi:hypothetical protein
LPDACGCYIFAMQNGKNIVAWYVGKTEKQTFYKECFGATKINYYNEILLEHNGTPLLFLLPRLTNAGIKFARPTVCRYPDVDFLEKLLISRALERNPELVNRKATKLLREMVVPGVINSPRGAPPRSVLDLQNALGLGPRLNNHFGPEVTFRPSESASCEIRIEEDSADPGSETNKEPSRQDCPVNPPL